jgi:hypothetical protein
MRIFLFLVCATFFHFFTLSLPLHSFAQNEIIKVTARGAGTSISEALADAYNNAIQQAIGLYIDAETIVNNDKIIKEQILTHSRGMIQNFDIVSEDTSGGLFLVTILAEVFEKPLLDKIKPITETFDFVDLSDLHASIHIEETESLSSEVLLRKALSPFFSSKLYKFSLYGKPYLNPKNNNQLIINILAKPNIQEYEKGIDELIVVLNQISTSKTETFNKHEDNKIYYKSKSYSDDNIFSLDAHDSVCDRRNYDSREVDRIAVNTWRSPNHKQTKWTVFYLPDFFYQEDFLKNYEAKYHHFDSLNTLVLEILLYDKQENLLNIGTTSIVNQWNNSDFPDIYSINQKIYTGSGGDATCLVVSEYAYSTLSQAYISEFIIEFSLDIDKDQLLNIHRIDIISKDSFILP